MSGDLWVMARNGTTLLPSEVKKLAADYDEMRRQRNDAQTTAVVEREVIEQLHARLEAIIKIKQRINEENHALQRQLQAADRLATAAWRVAQTVDDEALQQVLAAYPRAIFTPIAQEDA